MGDLVLNFDVAECASAKLTKAWAVSLVDTMKESLEVIAASKSFTLCFKSKAIKIKQPSFFLNELEIPTVEHCRYLGITISTKNNDLDIKRQMRKIHVNANLLLRKFSRCSVEVKCYLFKTYCSNLYCAPMWFDCTKTASKS